MKRIIKANILAGLLPGLVAPLVWPIVILLIEGKFPTLSTYPFAALSISFIAIVVGLVGCVVFGSPVLLGLEKLNLNTPAIAGTSGFIIALIMYLLFAVINDYQSLSQSWPLAAFFVIIGSVCGSAASLLSRTS